MADKPTIVIKKIKVAEAGHGAAAWKIAYADFVTAMMAFFLLMWLLSVVNTQTLTNIANYFSQSTASGPSGSGGQFNGETANTPGTATKPMHEDLATQIQGATSSRVVSKGQDNNTSKQNQQGPVTSYQNLKQNIQTSVKALPIALQKLFPTVHITDTKDGKLIRIFEDKKNPIFIPDTAVLTVTGVRILKIAAYHLKKIHYPLDIIGVVQDHDKEDPSEKSWRLALMRASAALKSLQNNGIPEKQFHTVQIKNTPQTTSNTQKQETPKLQEAIRIFIHKKEIISENAEDEIGGVKNLTPPALMP